VEGCKEDYDGLKGCGRTVLARRMLEGEGRDMDKVINVTSIVVRVLCTHYKYGVCGL